MKMYYYYFFSCLFNERKLNESLNYVAEFLINEEKIVTNEWEKTLENFVN